MSPQLVILNELEFKRTLDVSAFRFTHELWVPFYRLLALKLLRLLVIRTHTTPGTPVDTGRARGNWQLSVNAPLTGTLDVLDKSGSSPIALAATAVNAVQGFEDIWLTNNLPYILALEEGHSKQAPSGFVVQAIDFIEDWLRREFAKLETKEL
ncbi:MAG: HK97 gp10 family phage protein [bacterium]|nr:HK97 gp10 family phage protein [bacterium]